MSLTIGPLLEGVGRQPFDASRQWNSRFFDEPFHVTGFTPEPMHTSSDPNPVSGCSLISGSDCAEQSSGSPLLRLSDEPRNMIFEQVASSGIVLDRYGGTNGISALTWTSNQIRNEFVPVMLSKAPLTAFVDRLDFDHLSRFLNDLETLPAPFNTKIQRKASTQIVLSVISPWALSRSSLRTWLKYCGECADRPHNLRYVARCSKPRCLKKDFLAEPIRQHIADSAFGLTDPKSLEEADKIVSAFEPENLECGCGT